MSWLISRFSQSHVYMYVKVANISKDPTKLICTQKYSCSHIRGWNNERIWLWNDSWPQRTVIFQCNCISCFCVSTITSSCLIIAVLLKDRNTLFAGTFYKIMLNIVMSDLMTGLIGDTGAFHFLIREGLIIEPSSADVYWVHIPSLLTGSVAILTFYVLTVSLLYWDPLSTEMV